MAKVPFSDGLILSRWRRRRTTPFGQDFAYTDPSDLKVTYAGKLPPWYRRMWAKWRTPWAWIVVDPEGPITAEVMHSKSGECRVSKFKVGTIMPTNDQRLFWVAEEYERSQDDTPPAQA